MIIVEQAADLSAYLDTVLESPLVTISDDMITRFVALSGDRQWIHTATADARIVPGNLLISLIPQLMQGTFAVSNMQRALTVKYDDVRFLSPLHAGAGVQARITITDVRKRDGGTFVSVSVVLIDASDRREILRCRLVDKYEG
ncbi:MAG: MaoC/PaaZ C-terminal domain-containing protein [Rhodospirillales bacterium]